MVGMHQSVHFQQLLLKVDWQLLIKLNLPYNPAVPFPGIHPKEMKAYVFKKMFIGVLLIKVKKSVNNPLSINK